MYMDILTEKINKDKPPAQTQPIQPPIPTQLSALMSQVKFLVYFVNNFKANDTHAIPVTTVALSNVKSSYASVISNKEPRRHTSRQSY
jgi:hypothetical protein